MKSLCSPACERASPVFVQPDSPEYRAACKLWDLYLRTKNEFVQRGEFDEDDEDGYNLHDNPGGCAEDEVSPQAFVGDEGCGENSQ